MAFNSESQGLVSVSPAEMGLVPNLASERWPRQPWQLERLLPLLFLWQRYVN